MSDNIEVVVGNAEGVTSPDKGLEEKFVEMQASLTDEMKKIYEVLTTGEDTILSQTRDIASAILEGLSSLGGHSADAPEDAEADVVSSPASVTLEDMKTVDKQWVLGSILINNTLTDMFDFLKESFKSLNKGGGGEKAGKDKGGGKGSSGKKGKYDGLADMGESISSFIKSIEPLVPILVVSSKAFGKIKWRALKVGLLRLEEFLDQFSEVANAHDDDMEANIELAQNLTELFLYLFASSLAATLMAPMLLPVIAGLGTAAIVVVGGGALASLIGIPIIRKLIAGGMIAALCLAGFFWAVFLAMKGVVASGEIADAAKMAIGHVSSKDSGDGKKNDSTGIMGFLEALVSWRFVGLLLGTLVIGAIGAVAGVCLLIFAGTLYPSVNFFYKMGTEFFVGSGDFSETGVGKGVFGARDFFDALMGRTDSEGKPVDKPRPIVTLGDLFIILPLLLLSLSLAFASFALVAAIKTFATGIDASEIEAGTENIRLIGGAIQEIPSLVLAANNDQAEGGALQWIASKIGGDIAEAGINMLLMLFPILILGAIGVCLISVAESLPTAFRLFAEGTDPTQVEKGKEGVRVLGQAIGSIPDLILHSTETEEEHSPGLIASLIGFIGGDFAKAGLELLSMVFPLLILSFIGSIMERIATTLPSAIIAFGGCINLSQVKKSQEGMENLGTVMASARHLTDFAQGGNGALGFVVKLVFGDGAEAALGMMNMIFPLVLLGFVGWALDWVATMLAPAVLKLSVFSAGGVIDKSVEGINNLCRVFTASNNMIDAAAGDAGDSGIIGFIVGLVLGDDFVQGASIFAKIFILLEIGMLGHVLAIVGVMLSQAVSVFAKSFGDVSAAESKMQSMCGFFDSVSAMIDAVANAGNKKDGGLLGSVIGWILGPSFSQAASIAAKIVPLLMLALYGKVLHQAALPLAEALDVLAKIDTRKLSGNKMAQLGEVIAGLQKAIPQGSFSDFFRDNDGPAKAMEAAANTVKSIVQSLDLLGDMKDVTQRVYTFSRVVAALFNTDDPDSFASTVKNIDGRDMGKGLESFSTAIDNLAMANKPLLTLIDTLEKMNSTISKMASTINNMTPLQDKLKASPSDITDMDAKTKANNQATAAVSAADAYVAAISNTLQAWSVAGVPVNVQNFPGASEPVENAVPKEAGNGAVLSGE